MAKNKGKKEAPAAVVSYPAARGTKPKAKSGPKITKIPGGGIRVTNSEYLMDIRSNVDFTTNLSRPISLGDTEIFPWLSRLSALYETLKFCNLKFSYRCGCPTSTAGSVMMAVDQDPSDSTPTSKAEMLAWFGSKRCEPYASMKVDAFANSTGKPLRTFFGTESGSTDVRFDAIGRLVVATTGGSAEGTQWGELWAEYAVDLMFPTLHGTQTIGLDSGIGVSDTIGACFENGFASGQCVGTRIEAVPNGSDSQYLHFTRGGRYQFDIDFHHTSGEPETAPTDFFRDAKGATISSGGGKFTILEKSGSHAFDQLVTTWTYIIDVFEELFFASAGTIAGFTQLIWTLRKLGKAGEGPYTTTARGRHERMYGPKHSFGPAPLLELPPREVGYVMPLLPGTPLRGRPVSRG